MTADDRVPVLGASGGVGGMIVSPAHAAGATVWGQTGSEHKAAASVEQGAERAIVAGPDKLGNQIAEYEPTVVFDRSAVASSRPLWPPRRVDRVLALEDVNEAFERLKLRAVEGKLLLDLGWGQ